jgi:hypothetical protein
MPVGAGGLRLEIAEQHGVVEARKWLEPGMIFDRALTQTVICHNNAFGAAKVLNNFVEHDGPKWSIEENKNVPIGNIEFDGVLADNTGRDAKALQVILGDAAQLAGIIDADQLGKLMLRGDDDHVDEREFFRIDSGVLDCPLTVLWRAQLISNAVDEFFVAQIREPNDSRCVSGSLRATSKKEVSTTRQTRLPFVDAFSRRCYARVLFPFACAPST